MLFGAIAVVFALIIISVIVVLWPKIKQKLEKKYFYKNAGRTVYQIAMDKDFYVINDVAIAIDTKVIHFDHVLFGQKYIYCIGDSYQDAPLSGKFVDPKWFKYLKDGGTTHITNPMLIHKNRIEYLSSALHAEDVFIGIYVVNDSCIIDKIPDQPKNVFILHNNEIQDFVNKKEKSNVPDIDSIQMDSLVHTIYRKTQEQKEMKK